MYSVFSRPKFREEYTMRFAYGSRLLSLSLCSCRRYGVGRSANRKVAAAGSSFPGGRARWTPTKEKAGQTIKDGRLALKVRRSRSRPVRRDYWNPKNVAQGNYTVKATFNEPLYMNINNHPHPYGVFIGGNDMGTDNQSLVYCAAYGNGHFIVRGFGPAAFQMNGRGAPRRRR